jgi:mono/diheme cytochrome c family protein
MNKVVLGIVAIGVVGGLLPFALIARSRATLQDARPVHLVFDMDKQPKGKAQRTTPMYADQRFMRPHFEGTVAVEDLVVTGPALDDVLGTKRLLLQGGAETLVLKDAATYAAVVQGRVRTAGMSDEDMAQLKPPATEEAINADQAFYVRRIPEVFEVSVAFLQRGQERFNAYCAPCHGESGYGDGAVAARAANLVTTADAVSGWVAPQNLQEGKILGRPDGHIFNTITNGVRTMPAHDKQVAIEDRWAIVGYLRALERSQNAKPGDPGVKQ